jgi:hypothetical protein
MGGFSKKQTCSAVSCGRAEPLQRPTKEENDDGRANQKIGQDQQRVEQCGAHKLSAFICRSDRRARSSVRLSGKGSAGVPPAVFGDPAEYIFPPQESLPGWQKIACGWNAVCYFANDLRYGKCQFNRRTRERIFFAVGFLSLVLWLFMATAEICTPLHAWLHGGTIPKDDDDCAIVAIAHGQFDSPTGDMPVVAPVTWIEATPPRVEFSVFSPAIENLPQGRAPPASCIAS